MQGIAVGLLIFMAVLFVVAFILQERIPWFGYIRAAAEGGMVGALADWFAVTALFRHPLGIPIPHTNLIANKKDEIGEGLGSFIEENFLSDEVVHDKLSQISGARMAGSWLREPGNAQRVSDMAAGIGLGALTVLDDRDVQDLIESLVRRHVVDPEWGPLLGRATESFISGGHHESLVDLAADRLELWLVQHPQAFDKVISSRLPQWMPSIVEKFVDQRLHTEAVKFLQNVSADQDHPARIAITKFLHDLSQDLQEQ
ncbi:MAG: DUF445 family protein, partial [Leucobacter sp.]|nr:DUF445 family protein [Leucobacter sp.]